MPTALAAVLLLALTLVACGGGGDAGSTGTEASSTQKPGSKAATEGAQNGATGKDGGDGSPPASGGGEGSGGGGASSEASNFVPKPHKDSGGGSQTLRVKGGDNSVQEFGAEAGGSDFERAAAALHDYLDARAAGAWAAACSYMSKSIAESFKQLAAQAKQGDGSSCAAALETLTNPAAMKAMKDEAEQADVGSLRVEGERAFLIYRGVENTIFAMPMANEGGAWKVGSLVGTPLS